MQQPILGLYTAPPRLELVVWACLGPSWPSLPAEPCDPPSVGHFSLASKGTERGPHRPACGTDIRSSSRGSSQRPAGDPRRSPVPGNGGLWRRSVGSISRVQRRGGAAEHRRSDCPEEVARMQPRVPPTMAAEQAGVSKIGSWWRLASVPPGGEGGVARGLQCPLR